MTGLSAGLIAQASVSYDAVRITPTGVFWIEGRSDGRDVLVRWTEEHGSQDLTPDGFSVASYVHEYGGGAWVADGETVWFCNATDQRIYRTAAHGAVPVTPAPPEPGAVRYADLRVDPGGRWLWGIRERHDDGVVNDLVRIPAEAGAPPQAVSARWDFYSFPRPSPDGRWLAWTCWNAPQMPWDGTFLYVAETGPEGELGAPVLVAGGTDESVFQPEWSPDGVLHFVSDRDGWWGLYKWEDGRVVPVLIGVAELGVAQWEFGYSTYAFLDGGRIAVVSQKEARQSLKMIEQQQVRTVRLPYTSVKPYLSANGNQVAMIASSPVQTPSVVVVDAGSGGAQTIASAQPLVDRQLLSHPESFSFTTRDGAEVHGLFYPPWGGAADARPPLVVKAHPGPTANIQMRLDWHTQFLTSHGFAVAEIDYRGSTGYGRAFRNALRGHWGERDALDCADAAEYLASTGRANPQRTAIWGASAGGYTALRALILTRTFAAGVARSPVIDPRTWRSAAPKFQAHHADMLIGPWPDAANTYRARSLLGNADAINGPVLVLHGEQDRITPVTDSIAVAKILGDRCRLALFVDEGHTLRSPESQRRALELETDFLATFVRDRHGDRND